MYCTKWSWEDVILMIQCLKKISSTISYMINIYPTFLVLSHLIEFFLPIFPSPFIERLPFTSSPQIVHISNLISLWMTLQPCVLSSSHSLPSWAIYTGWSTSIATPASIISLIQWLYNIICTKLEWVIHICWFHLYHCPCLRRIFRLFLFMNLVQCQGFIVDKLLVENLLFQWASSFWVSLSWMIDNYWISPFFLMMKY